METRDKISILLRKLGVNPANTGWVYLEESISMTAEDPMILNGITKKVYPVLAKKFNSTPSRVERAIRHSIDQAFTETPPAMIEAIFGNTISMTRDKPTNSHFIGALAWVVAREPNNPIWNM